MRPRQAAGLDSVRDPEVRKLVRSIISVLKYTVFGVPPLYFQRHFWDPVTLRYDKTPSLLREAVETNFLVSRRFDHDTDKQSVWWGVGQFHCYSTVQRYTRKKRLLMGIGTGSPICTWAVLSHAEALMTYDQIAMNATRVQRRVQEIAHSMIFT